MNNLPDGFMRCRNATFASALVMSIFCVLVDTPGALAVNAKPATTVKPATTAKSTAAAKAVDRQIAAIRSDVAAINQSLPKLKRITEDVFEYSAEGGTVSWYSDSSGVRKIEAKLFGETRRGTYEYFYVRGRLIFGFAKIERYETDLTSPVASVQEQRLYLSSAKPIRLLLGTRQIPLSSEEGKVVVDELLYFSNEFVAARPS
jgi:hypothetical protein